MPVALGTLLITQDVWSIKAASECTECQNQHLAVRMHYDPLEVYLYNAEAALLNPTQSACARAAAAGESRMDQPGAVITILMHQLGCCCGVLPVTILCHRWKCKASKAQPLQSNRNRILSAILLASSDQGVVSCVCLMQTRDYILQS